MIGWTLASSAVAALWLINAHWTSKYGPNTRRSETSVYLAFIGTIALIVAGIVQVGS